MVRKKKNLDLFSEAEPIETPTSPEGRVFSVGEFIEILNVGLKQEVRIMGEVSQVQRAASGHVYFTIKDSKDDAVMNCVMWKFNYGQCGIDMQVGMELILTGNPQVYAPTGRFSFVASAIEFVGEGALKKAYDELKKKLTLEGVFAKERKRALPLLARKIGVVTSKEGAVIHDFINNLGKFGYEVSLVDSRVEGQQAVGPLIEAIQTLKKKDIEVLVVIRGGGSLESLQAFNNEALIREMVAFPVPVIAGIGHDQDVPLAALAADFMTSTPTAAAHLINASWEEAYAKVKQFTSIMNRIEDRMRRVRMDIDMAMRSVVDHTQQRILYIYEQLVSAERVMKVNDPTRQLKLGYSIVRERGKVIKSIKGIAVGDTLTIQLSDGEASSEVKSIA